MADQLASNVVQLRPGEAPLTDEQEFRLWRDDNMESHGVKAAFLAGLRRGRQNA